MPGLAANAQQSPCDGTATGERYDDENRAEVLVTKPGAASGQRLRLGASR